MSGGQAHKPTIKEASKMSIERIPSSESIELDNIPLDLASRSSSDSCGTPSPASNTRLPKSVTFNGSSDRFGLHCLGTEQNGTQYVNKDSLAHDLSFLATMPELCDVTFLVGEDRQPVCAVRAILAARSWVFRKLLYSEPIGGPKKKKKSMRSSDGYIEKYDFKGHPTVVVKDFDPEVFKQLVTYTHTGSVVLQARTLLGLMNAADHYGLEDLKQACIRFMEHCITVDTVCSLLTSAEKYIQYKSTKILVQKMLEFVDTNAVSILALGAFSTLPQHVVRIVLGREELEASATKKFEAAYRWYLHHADANSEIEIKAAFEPFVDVIDFSQIPASHLMKNVKPAGVVDDSVILTALAYQADPKSVDHIRPHSSAASISKPRPSNFRRVQSSGNPLNVGYRDEATLTGRGRTKRAGSVPPSDTDLQLRGDSHPMRLLNTRDRMSSQSSSHLTTPPISPSLDSFHGSSTLSSASSFEPDDYHGNVSLSQPVTFESTRVGYDPRVLDTIVTMSSTNAVEV